MLRAAALFAASLVVVGVPTLGAVYLAHREARTAEFERVGLLVQAVQGRNERAGTQVRAAYERLALKPGEAPCSPARIALMREIDLGSTYLQAVGHIANERLMCSSLGDHRPGLPLGPVAFASPRGSLLRPNVRLALLPGRDLLVSDFKGAAALMHPDLITDITTQDDVWTGVFHIDKRRTWVQRGGFRAAWARRVRSDGATAHFIDGDRVVALRRLPGQPIGFYAATPFSALADRAHALSWRLAPAGALAGLLLWLMLRWQRQRSKSLPALLKAAIEGDEIRVEYQPIVELGSGRWVGAEALVRWRRADGSTVRPDVFIQVAEDNQLICRLTERVVSVVGAEARALLLARPDFHIAINLSSADLASPRTVALFRDLVRRPGFAPHNISVEATERGLLDVEATRRVLDEIRALGIRAAIDDFGTGYSGLSYLGKFPIDTLKIDKSFVDTVGTDAVTANVAAHIIELARALGLEMVAEGIERAEQADFLRRHGVQFGQGWLFARSLPMAILMARLDAMDGREAAPDPAPAAG